MSRQLVLSYLLPVVAGTLRAEANTGSPIRQTDPSPLQTVVVECRASAMSFAHLLIASQSRKSPSYSRTTIITAFSAKPKASLSSLLPSHRRAGITRCCASRRGVQIRDPSSQEGSGPSGSSRKDYPDRSVLSLGKRDPFLAFGQSRHSKRTIRTRVLLIFRPCCPTGTRGRGQRRARSRADSC